MIKRITLHSRRWIGPAIFSLLLASCGCGGADRSIETARNLEVSDWRVYKIGIDLNMDGISDVITTIDYDESAQTVVMKTKVEDDTVLDDTEAAHDHAWSGEETWVFDDLGRPSQIYVKKSMGDLSSEGQYNYSYKDGKTDVITRDSRLGAGFIVDGEYTLAYQDGLLSTIVEKSKVC